MKRYYPYIYGGMLASSLAANAVMITGLEWIIFESVLDRLAFVLAFFLIGWATVGKLTIVCNL